MHRPVPSALGVVCALLLASGGAATLRAQEVGHDPDSSPYHDLDAKHDFSLFAGYWHAGKDLAGVAPRSGPLLGIRYDLLLGKSPVFLVGRFTHVIDDRSVIDPTLPASIRVLNPSQPAALNIIDGGFGVQLTGHKTFHRLAPVINVGAGLVTDFGGLGGPGHYHLGNQFAFTYGGGVRWIPGGPLSRLLIRGDLNNYMYDHHYPTSYHTLTADGSSAIPFLKPLAAWRNNGAFTLGVWYSFLR